MKLKSISIPAISSGIFGFPKPLCAKILAKTIKNFLDQNNSTCLTEIRLTNIDQETVLLMKKEVMKLFEGLSSAYIALNEQEKKPKERNHTIFESFEGSIDIPKEEDEKYQEINFNKVIRTEIIDDYPYKKLKINEERSDSYNIHDIKHTNNKNYKEIEGGKAHYGQSTLDYFIYPYKKKDLLEKTREKNEEEKITENKGSNEERNDDKMILTSSSLSMEIDKSIIFKESGDINCENSEILNQIVNVESDSDTATEEIE